MKKLILGISVMISGILLTCAAVIAGGMIASSKGVYFLSASWEDNTTVIWVVVIGALVAISGLILSLLEVFGKKQ